MDKQLPMNKKVDILTQSIENQTLQNQAFQTLQPDEEDQTNEKDKLNLEIAIQRLQKISKHFEQIVLKLNKLKQKIEELYENSLIDETLLKTKLDQILEIQHKLDGYKLSESFK